MYLLHDFSCGFTSQHCLENSGETLRAFKRGGVAAHPERVEQRCHCVRELRGVGRRYCCQRALGLTLQH